MSATETNGLASYQQTVYQTPGVASSIWTCGTSVHLPVVIEITPTQIEKRDKRPPEENTAFRDCPSMAEIYPNI